MTAERRERLALDFLPLARRSARRIRDRWPSSYRDPDDAYSDALLALWRAARTYEPGRGVHFSTHYRWQLRRVTADHNRAFARTHEPGDTLPIGVPGIDDEAPDPHPSDPLGDLAAADAAEAVLRRLPGREAEAMRLTVIEGRTEGEAAMTMGITQQRVNQLLCRAKKRLRRSCGYDRGPGRARCED